MTGKSAAKKEPVAEPGPAEATAQVDEHPGGWHLVTYGTWQVSVGPDGLIMLPRHLTHDEVEDFCGAILGAADVAEAKVAVNKERGQGDDRTLPPKLHINHGGVPAGAMRMPFAGGARMTPQQAGNAGFAVPHTPSQMGPQPAGTQGSPPARVPSPPRPRNPPRVPSPPRPRNPRQ